MITIIRFSLWQRRWLIFWWALGVSVLVALTIGFYPAFAEQANEFEKTLQHLPDTAKSFISDTKELTSPEGFLSSQLYYLTLPLIFSVLAISLGAGLIAKEEESGTIELLLSRPVSRGKLLLAKALAGLTIIAFVATIAAIVAALLCKAVDMDISIGRVIGVTYLSAILAAFLGSTAYFVTTLGKTARLASIGLPVVLGLAGYIVASLSAAVNWLEWPDKFLPYHYYQPGRVLYGNYDWWNVAVLVMVTSLLAVIAWHSFRRRDLNG